MSVLVRNEQRKYLATAANNLGGAAIVTGTIAPTAGFVTGALQMQSLWRLAIAAIIWFAIGISCMFGAQRFLRRLE